MNKDQTTREVIARAIASKAESEPDDQSWRDYQFEADAVLAALAAAGLSIVDTPTEWEWGHRTADGRTFAMPTEQYARNRVREHDLQGCVVVRRHPGQPWEVAP